MFWLDVGHMIAPIICTFPQLGKRVDEPVALHFHLHQPPISTRHVKGSMYVAYAREIRGCRLRYTKLFARNSGYITVKIGGGTSNLVVQ